MWNSSVKDRSLGHWPPPRSRRPASHYLLSLPLASSDFRPKSRLFAALPMKAPLLGKYITTLQDVLLPGSMISGFCLLACLLVW